MGHCPEARSLCCFSLPPVRRMARQGIKKRWWTGTRRLPSGPGQTKQLLTVFIIRSRITANTHRRSVSSYADMRWSMGVAAVRCRTNVKTIVPAIEGTGSWSSSSDVDGAGARARSSSISAPMTTGCPVLKTRPIGRVSSAKYRSRTRSSLRHDDKKSCADSDQGRRAEVSARVVGHPVHGCFGLYGRRRWGESIRGH